MKYKIIKYEYGPLRRSPQYAAMVKNHWWSKWKGIHYVFNVYAYRPEELKTFSYPEQALRHLKETLQKWENEEEYPKITEYKRIEE